MKLQLIDNEGNLVQEEEFSKNKFDTLFMMYDSFDNLELTLLENGRNLEEEFIPKTKQTEAIKKYMQQLTQQYVEEYMKKYEKADTDLAEYKAVQ